MVASAFQPVRMAPIPVAALAGSQDSRVLSMAALAALRMLRCKARRRLLISQRPRVMATSSVTKVFAIHTARMVPTRVAALAGSRRSKMPRRVAHARFVEALRLLAASRGACLLELMPDSGCPFLWSKVQKRSV